MRKIVLIFLLAVIFLMASVSYVFANNDRHLPLLVDDADLLTDSEEELLNAKLESISSKHKCEVAIVTVDSLNGEDPQDYADDFFDYNGYGYGINDDGILLLISMEYSDWHITTHGYAIKAFTDAGLDYLSGEFLPYLSDGDFNGAFTRYADLCDELLTMARNGSPYDGKVPMAFTTRILIALGVGIVIALIVTGIMRAQLKSVRFQPAAESYIKKNSFNVSVSRDLFLYSKVDRRAKPKNTSSTTHTSSSGRTHGGKGGKF